MSKILPTALIFFCLRYTAGSDSDQSVSINGDTYSVMEAPSETSSVVEEEMKVVLRKLNLTQLTFDLKFVGTYISIAYNGVEEFPIIQGKVQSMAIRVNKLTDKTAVTILEFETACRTVLEHMQVFYQYLLLNMEGVAHEFLTYIAEVAEEMADAANRLHKEYDKEVDNIQNILEDAFTAKDLKHEEVKKLSETKDNFTSYLASAEQTRKNAMEAEKKYEYFFQEARRKEEEAQEHEASPWKKLVNFVTSLVGFQAYDLGAYKTAAEAAAAEKFRYLNEMQIQQNKRAEALKEIAEFTTRIEHAQTGTELAIAVLDSLRSAMGGLKNVASIMMDAAMFWGRMRVHIGTLYKKNILLKELEAFKQDKSLERPWKTKYFKERAVKFCARWVALYRVCKEFSSHMDKVRKDLRAVVRLNPTKEEALANVRRLAKEFAPQLNAAINQIENDQEKSSVVKDEL